jgi:hypothetical protein
VKVRRTKVPVGTKPPAGFPRWAWWTLFLATFTFAVPLTSPWWSTVLRSEIPGASEDDREGTPVEGADTSAAAPVPGSTLKVVLHTRVPDQPGLTEVSREVPYVRGVIPQIHAAVSELSVASADAPAFLPPGTRVLDVAFTQGGTVYLDFSPELDVGRAVGPEEEKLLVQGIVETVASNFTAVRRVVLLVDGKAPRPYHLDLTRPLRPDDPIFAVSEEPEPPTVSSPNPIPTPTPTPNPAPAGAPPAQRPSPTPVPGERNL